MVEHLEEIQGERIAVVDAGAHGGYRGPASALQICAAAP
jgi:hypothetical protein